jgi:hypothetical protein
MDATLAGMSGKALLSALRLAAGPLALAGFFLPWTDGPGLLVSATFTGFSLLRFTGDLQGLELSFAAGGGLWLARLALVGVPVAATWQLALAPRLRWHPGYRISGWYLTAFTALALGIGLWRVGLSLPRPGLALLAAGALCFLAAQLKESRRAAGGAGGR